MLVFSIFILDGVAESTFPGHSITDINTFKLVGAKLGVPNIFYRTKQNWSRKSTMCSRSLIRSSRGIGYSSNKGAYRIIERCLCEFLIDGDFQFLYLMVWLRAPFLGIL